MRSREKIEKIVKRVLAEATVKRLDPDELEEFYSENVSVLGLAPMTLETMVERSQKVDPPLPNPMQLPIYIKSSGYHMKAGTLKYIEPPPESGMKPYFLLSM
jgi:hypothetical protein